LRPQNLLLSFGNEYTTLQKFLEAEKWEDENIDPAHDVLYESSDGIAVIYVSRPLNLVADGDLVDLGELKVKIADFGKGLFFKVLQTLTSSDFY
jgi:hypothetical protein